VGVRNDQGPVLFNGLEQTDMAGGLPSQAQKWKMLLDPCTAKLSFLGRFKTHSRALLSLHRKTAAKSTSLQCYTH